LAAGLMRGEGVFWTYGGLIGMGILLAGILLTNYAQYLRYRVARRARAGLCETCGYDLRASKDRCPECGSPIPPKEGNGMSRRGVIRNMCQQ
jgi:hypothetical protein